MKGLNNRSKCFPPEYLHSVLEGTVELFVHAMFNPANYKEKWYLGKFLNEFDRKLQNMKPPSEVTRTPRSLEDLTKWKASEWKTFLVYYSLV